MYLKTHKEISIMKEAGFIVKEVLNHLSNNIKVGMSTLEVSKMAEDCVANNFKGAHLAFKGYRGFPEAVCISVNDEVIHGIPTKDKIIKNGDLVSLDFGVKFRGYYADSAITIIVGEGTQEAKDLIEVTRNALKAGILEAKEGNMLSDISIAMERYVETRGYSIVRDYGGHGIGRQLHEKPFVANHGGYGVDMELEVGMTLAIEPEVNIGGCEVETQSNNWTVSTKDGSLSAHFEHTIAITKKGALIITGGYDEN